MTSERECLESLREAAARLGESPTKAQYEELGLTPASATIMKTLGGWNAAKERAGLETFDRGATGNHSIQPKPDWVDIPDDSDWADLTGQQRWYYKNRDARIERKDRRRKEIRQWLYTYKELHCECSQCGEGRPPCLDFHHPDEKENGIATMVVNGHSKTSIREEIDRCIVLCANCHRIEHADPPDCDSTPFQPDSHI
ncbi:homing endonuclease associated repeat-containing protein [Natronorubrum aibiense]|uniref:HNH endonuclease n=1 Tax=Natronorubrum aibiense TaxID=348826 RepID=A0A5P9P1X6_9EURY|nr:HNH endonuclease [Natronorubrum aibiense]QFU82129.1 HNH endonuclease [Natronorubrum aibiense]